MEVFQNLRLFVLPNKEQKFVSLLFDKAERNQWMHKSDFESNYKRNTASSTELVFCFESHQIIFDNKTLHAFLWMWKRRDYFEVFNIVPAKSGRLSYSEYNHILNTFFNEVLKPIIIELNLRTEFSKPNKTIIDLIGEEAGDALLLFSRNANKATGNSHPYDFNRWCEFVFLIHRKHIKLNIDDFIRWLEEEENWSSEIALELGLDLEYALNILEKYEQN